MALTISREEILTKLRECGVSEESTHMLSKYSTTHINKVFHQVMRDRTCISILSDDFMQLRQTHIAEAAKMHKDMPSVYMDFMKAFKESGYDRLVEDVGLTFPFYRKQFSRKDVAQLYYFVQDKMPITCKKYIARLMEACMNGGLKDKFHEAYEHDYKIANLEVEIEYIRRLVPLFGESKLWLSILESEVYNGYKSFVSKQQELKKEKAKERNHYRLNDIKDFLKEYLNTENIWSISAFYTSKGKSKGQMFGELAFIENNDPEFYDKIRQKSKMHLNVELQNRLNDAAKKIQKSENFSMLNLYRETGINYVDLLSIVHTNDPKAKVIKNVTKTVIMKILTKYENSMFSISKDFIDSDYYSFKGYELTQNDKDIIYETMKEEKLPMAYQIYRDLTREYITEKINNQ